MLENFSFIYQLVVERRQVLRSCLAGAWASGKRTVSCFGRLIKHEVTGIGDFDNSDQVLGVSAICSPGNQVLLVMIGHDRVG